MKNQLTIDLEQIEDQIRKLHIKSKGEFKILDANKAMMFDSYNAISENIKSRLYKPWETSHSANYYWFEYRLPERPNIRIKVCSTQQPLNHGE